MNATPASEPADALRLLESMVAALDGLLAGASPYREVSVPAPGGGRRVRTVSIGLLVDLLERLEGQEQRLDGQGRRRLAVARAAVEARRGPGAWAELVGRELRANVDAWRAFVDDCRSGEAGCVEAHPAESRRRLRIAQLLREGERVGLDTGDDAERTARADGQLRPLWQPGPYVGPSGEAGRYPSDTHWWLHGRPRED